MGRRPITPAAAKTVSTAAAAAVCDRVHTRDTWTNIMALSESVHSPISPGYAGMRNVR